MSNHLFISFTIAVGESDYYFSWLVEWLVGFLPRLKPWASSLYSCDILRLHEAGEHDGQQR